jgi:hypothetical protein
MSQLILSSEAGHEKVDFGRFTTPDNDPSSASLLESTPVSLKTGLACVAFCAARCHES